MLKLTAPVHISGRLDEVARLSEVPAGGRPLSLRSPAAMLRGSLLSLLVLHGQVTLPL